MGTHLLTCKSQAPESFSAADPEVQSFCGRVWCVHVGEADNLSEGLMTVRVLERFLYDQCVRDELPCALGSVTTPGLASHGIV